MADPRIEQAHQALEAVGFAMSILGGQEQHLRTLQREAVRFDSVAAIIDPTAFKAASYDQNVKLNTELVDVAVRFLAQARASYEKHGIAWPFDGQRKTAEAAHG